MRKGIKIERNEQDVAFVKSDAIFKTPDILKVEELPATAAKAPELTALITCKPLVPA
jgi:hypothetical protein